MLSVVALLWGILATFGILAGFIPCLSGVSWLNLPFALIGAVVGIVSMFMRPQGGTKSAVIGTSLCMLACLAAIFRLIVGSGDV